VPTAAGGRGPDFRPGRDAALKPGRSRADKWSTMPAAISYDCTCGRRHLVSLTEPTPHGLEWDLAVLHAAELLEAGVVDGHRAAFVCEGCGTVHVKGDAPAFALDELVGLTHTVVLN